MLEHLLQEIDDAPSVLVVGQVIDKRRIVHLDRLDAASAIAAKAAAGRLLEPLGAQPCDLDNDFARAAASTAMIPDTPIRQMALAATPAAAQRALSLLDAYDLEFVEHASRIRSMIVTKLIEDTALPTAKDRHRAIELLGKVAEIDLFTSKKEKEKEVYSEDELDKRIKARLNKIMGGVEDAQQPAPRLPPLENALDVEHAALNVTQKQ
jgi:hypothetical protein